MDEFGNLVDMLVSLNIRNRGLIPKNRLAPLERLIYHETVHVNIGRYTGKTNYILTHAKDGDIIVTYSQPSAKDLLKKLGTNNHIKVIYRSEDLNYYENKKYKTMYIDEPRLCFRNVRLESLYDYFYNQSVEEQLVIMLGE